MNFARLASRVAVGGVATALATAGMVGVTGTSASAAPVSTTYTCATPLASFPVAVSVELKVPLTTAPAGFPIAAGLLSFDTTATIPDAVQTVLDGLPGGPVTGGKSADFGASFGGAVATAPAAWTKPAAAVGGNWVYTGTGSNLAFVLPQAGTYTITMPKSFTLTATNASGATVAAATCTSATPAQLGSITLSKQVSTVKAKAKPTTAHKGDVVAVKGKVTNEFQKLGGPVPTGKVIVKDGKKTVAKGKLKNGKFVLKVKGLKVGAHKLVVTYKGDGYTAKGKSKTLKVVVKP
jgi:hypothetical protein